MDLGGSNAVEILGKALRVWNIEDIAVGVGWFGWELGIILYPQELMMAGSMQGVTQRSFLHTEQGCRVLWGTEGKDGGSPRPCLHVQRGWGAAADSAAPQMPQSQKGWAALGEAQHVLGVSPRRAVLWSVTPLCSLISITWTSRGGALWHIQPIPVEGCSGWGLLSVQGCWAPSLHSGLFVCLCALEGTNTGKGAVLGDLVQVPPVPLITDAS